MDQCFKNITLITLLVLLETTQILVIAIWVYGFIPIPIAPIAKGVVPQLLQLFKPNRNIMFYRLGIVVAMLMQAGVCHYFKSRIEKEDLSKKLVPFILNLSLWVGLEIFAAFKLLQYHNPLWAHVLFYVALGLSLLTQVFWVEIVKSRRVVRLYIEKAQKARFQWCWDAVVVLGIAMIVLCPKQPYFWISLQAIVYFSIYYFLLNGWLRKRVWACVGVFLAIKLNLFNGGQYPIAWKELPLTALRNVLDLPVLCLLFAYTQKPSSKWLFACGGLIGLASFDDVLTGFSLFAAYIVFISMNVLSQGGKLKQAWFILWPTAVYFVVILVNGRGWPNFAYDIKMFASGWNALPITICLYNRQFFAYDMAFIVPLVYIITILTIASRLVFKRAAAPEAFVMAVAVYGLGWYHHFLYYSLPWTYYAAAMPLVITLLFWVTYCQSFIPVVARGPVAWSAGVLVTIGLLTNNLFLIYPHVIHYR